MAKKVVKTNKNSKPIEASAEKNFMSKRNIFLIVFGLLIALLIIGLTIKYILNIDFNQLGKSMREGFSHSLGYLWFFLLILYTIINIAYNSLALIPRMKHLGIKVPFYEWILMSITISFLKAVTPANLVSDPYTIFWLRTRGCPTSKATSLTFTNTFLWEAAQICITLPSLIFLTINHYSIMHFSNGNIDPQGISVFVFMWVGFGIDIFGIFIMYLLCTSKRLHYRLSTIFNWFKKKLHMKYHTKEETAEKYKVKAVMKQDFIIFMKDWKGSLIVFLIWFGCEFVSYSAVSWSLNFVQYVNGIPYKVDYWTAFHCANLAFTANKLNFLPGGEGGIQWFLQVLIQSVGHFAKNYSPQNRWSIVTNNGIIVWDAFRNLIPGAIGIIGMIVLTIRQVKQYKKSKSLNL